MIIRIFEESPFAQKIDAYSRVKIFASNAIDSPEIICYGNVTRLRSGGITFGNHDMALVASLESGHSLAQLLPDGSIARLQHPDPCLITEILAAQDGQDVLTSSLFRCRKLGLFARDPDKVTRLWSRSFCDLEMMQKNRFLNIKEKDGSLDCLINMLMVNGFVTPMEVKFFKTGYAPGTLSLYFNPTRSRLWLPHPYSASGMVYVTSNLGTVLNNRGKFLCWFLNCGNLDEIDFSVLQWYCTVFLVMEFADDPSRTRDSYAEALAFKTAALRQSTPVSIMVLQLGEESWHLQGIRGRGYTDPPEKALMDEEFIRKCDELKLKVDPILRGNPYEIKFSKCEDETKVLLPDFFDRGKLTLFQESINSSSIRSGLIKLLNGSKRLIDHSATIINTLMFCRKGSRHRVKKQIRNMMISKLKVYADMALLAPGLDAVDEMNTLLDEIRPELVLLELSGYSPQQEESLLAAVDTCLNNGISVGIFCEDGKVPSNLADMADKELIVGTVDSDSYIVKEKVESGQSSIRRFNFKGEVVSVEESGEKELAEAMKTYK